MHTPSYDLKIPSYDLQQDEDDKVPFIKIVVADEQTFKQKKIFLTPHRKNYYLLVFIRKGTGRHWVDMIPYDLEPDTFYFTTPEQVHLKEEAKLSGILISFTKEYIALEENLQLATLPLLQNLQNGHELILRKDEKIQLNDLLEKLVTEYQNSLPWQSQILSAYIKVLLVSLSRVYSEQYDNKEPFQSRKLYRRYQACIEENYKKAHEVNVYAKMLSVSVSHLNTLMKKQSGKTAISHIHDRLLLEAKRMLVHTDCSIKEITYELGFKDDSYFNRFFKRMTGQTATGYRTASEMYR